MATPRQLHVVMVPYPVQGQINPMMQFAKLLTAPVQPSDADITVTVVHNKHNFDCLQPQSGDDAHVRSPVATAEGAASLHSSKIQLTWVENGLPPDFDYDDITASTALEFFRSTLRMKEPVKQLLESLKHTSSPVSCVLFGMFCPWAHSVAAELGIPTFFFWTQSAAVFSIYYHMPLLVINGFFPYNKQKGLATDCAADATDWVTYLPGLPPLRPSSFPTLLQVDNFDDNPLTTLIKEQFSTVRSCNGVIINSFEELEKNACQALREELPCPTFSVGPLLPSAFLEGSDARGDLSIGASLRQEKSDCIEWLDGQKQKHSVLYIAFGSLVKPSAEDLEAIAMGIKSSKQPFLWAIRPNSSTQDACDILPKGFVEDTKEYGLIITWAPQLQVLSHPSVGAFLTHCGWNSTLESMSMGLPMISFPFFLDQPTNSACVCDFWRVGVALKRQEDGKVKSEDVKKAVLTTLHEEEGLEMRERASKLRNAARQAVQVHGSSQVYIKGFIQALHNFSNAL